MAQRFGRYWLHEKIGHGGMAEVFRATMGPSPDRSAFDLAIKKLHLHLERDPVQRDMFLTEADVAKLLRHPQVLTVYEAGTIEGHAYITMEYVHGHDMAELLQLLRRKRLRIPSDLAVHVTLQVLRALDYVHEARSSAGDPMGIVHRDVTPQNIYISYAGDVKLGDFGVARVNFLEASDDPVVKGKVRYMPPEVLLGDPVNQTMDLWSLAATLYEMLTGRLPLEGSEDDLMIGAFKVKIEPPHKINPDIDIELSKILARALHPKPHKRPQTAAALYRELKAYLGGQGIQVDKEALSRFVRNAAGAGETHVERRAGPTPPEFATPTYRVPMEATPTQRLHITPRARPGLLSLVVFGVVLLAGMGGLWFALSLGEPERVTDPVPTEQLALEDANVDNGDARAVFERLSHEDEEGGAPVIEFGEDFGDLPPGTLGTADSRYRALMHRGRVQAKRRRYDTAARAFAQASQMRPNSVAAYLAHANAVLALGDHAKAEQLVKKALQLEPRNARGHLLMGDVLWAAGKDKAAKAAYRRCIDLDPKGPAGKIAKQVLDNL